MAASGHAIRTQNSGDFPQVLAMPPVHVSAADEALPRPRGPARYAVLPGGRPALLAVTSSTLTWPVGSGASQSGTSHANGVLEASPPAWGWASVRVGSGDLGA